MTYIADTQDILFNLFDYLKLGQLTLGEKYKDQNEELYKMVFQEAHKFILKEVDPLHIPGDREGCHINNGQVTTPKGYKEAYKAFAEQGFLSMDNPPQLGGQGLPVSLMVSIFEILTGADIALSMYAGLTKGSAHVIEAFGSETLVSLFCPKMYSGVWAGTMCLTEPWAGSSVGDIKTSAQKNTDGTYAIKGSKIFISSGDHDLTDNIIHLVLARVQGDAPGTKGISLFVVPKVWVNPDGSLAESNDVSCVNIEHKMGIKAQATCSLNFGENDKCRGFLIGEQSKGMNYMFQLMNEARLLTGLQGVAIGGAAFEQARKYASERIQGGNKPIIDYPDVKRNLALSKAWIEGMRAFIYKTAYMLDQIAITTDPAEKEKLEDAVALAVPICKAYGSDFGFKVCELAIQVHGGYGYISEYPVEQHMRDCKISSLYEGTNGIQALDLVGRKLTLKNGQLFRQFYEDTAALCEKWSQLDPLAKGAQELKKAIDQIAQVAMRFMQESLSGNLNFVMLSATPFLEICGHAMISRILFEQAELCLKDTTDFATNKIKTANFFAFQILPLVGARTKSILSGDTSAIEIKWQ